MAIKILSATLLKNYRAFPFIRVLVVLLEKILLTHANWVRTRRVLSSSLSRHIVSLSFLVRLGLSALRPRRATVSTIRLLFRVYSLPVPSCSLHLSYSLAFRVSRVSSYCSESLLYPYLLSLILPIAFVLSNLFSSLSFVFHLSLAIFRWLSRLSFSFHSHSLCISLSLSLASLPCLVLTCTICFSPCFLFSHSFFSPCFSICLLLVPTRSLIYSCFFLSLFGLILCYNLFLSFSFAFHLSLANSLSFPLVTYLPLCLSFFIRLLLTPPFFSLALLLPLTDRTSLIFNMILARRNPYLCFSLSFFLFHSHSILYFDSFFIFYVLSISC